MSDVPTLLPFNASEAERALEQAQARIADVPTPQRTLWDPDTCPVPLLPWLAWTYSVDLWDPAWTEEVKRQVIRESAEVHRRKGTVGAIRRAVEALGYGIEFTEWWQTTGLDVHEFTVLVQTYDLGITAEAQRTLLAIIENTKPLRSHMADISVTALVPPAEAYVGAVPFDGAYSYHVAEVGALPLPGIPDGSLALVGESAPFSIYQYSETTEEWYALLVYVDAVVDLPLPVDTREGCLALVGDAVDLDDREVYVFVGGAWTLAGDPRVIARALLAELPAASAVKTGTVALVGSTPSQEIHASTGAAWLAHLVYRAAVGSLPATAREGAMALVGSSSPLRTRDAYLYEDAAWHLMTRSVRTLSGLWDVQPNDRDGDFGLLPTNNIPLVLRLKRECPVASGGTRPVWMTQIAYAGTPTLQMWADGTESNAVLDTQGWTRVPDTVDCTVAPVGGFQRLSAPASANAMRLHAMIGGLSASTRVETIFQARASTPASNTLALPFALFDGANATVFGQIQSAGVGFKDAGFGGPLNLPLRSSASPSMPALASPAATFVVRDEGRTVMSQALRDGLHLGDYRRDLQLLAVNRVQVSAQGAAGGGCIMDYRGQTLTY